MIESSQGVLRLCQLSVDWIEYTVCFSKQRPGGAQAV